MVLFLKRRGHFLSLNYLFEVGGSRRIVGFEWSLFVVVRSYWCLCLLGAAFFFLSVLHRRPPIRLLEGRGTVLAAALSLTYLSWWFGGFRRGAEGEWRWGRCTARRREANRKKKKRPLRTTNEERRNNKEPQKQKKNTKYKNNATKQINDTGNA